MNVTQHPTDEWTAQQIVEAFPGDEQMPRFLRPDRDSIYGQMFRKRIAAMGIEEVISARKSPWQNPYVERVIGSIRRECTDHIIAIGERHLLQMLLRYGAGPVRRGHGAAACATPRVRSCVRSEVSGGESFRR